MRTTVELIRDIPQLVAEIWATAAVGAPNPGGEQIQTSKPRAGSKPPVSMALVHALRADHRGLLHDYRQVCHAVRATTDCPTTVDDQADWAQVSEWLLATVFWWQTGGHIEDMIHNEICRIREPLAALAREPKRRPKTCDHPGCQEDANLAHDGQWWICPAGHESPGPKRQVRQYRLAPHMTTREAAAEFKTTSAAIWKACQRKLIAPTRVEGRVHYWAPWDLLRWQQPDLVALVEDNEDAA